MAVGKAIAIIETEGSSNGSSPAPAASTTGAEKENTSVKESAPSMAAVENSESYSSRSASGKFFSPLVLSIAKEENISMPELERIAGSGKDSRVTKKDILLYIENRGKASASPAPIVSSSSVPASSPSAMPEPQRMPVSISAQDEIIEMDRMRKMIAQRMIDSKRISPHVTSFVEADVTAIVHWRNKWKNEFKEKEGDNLTFTPIFIEAVAKAIKDYPMINVQVDGDRIIKKKDINIGMAVALPSGNLIVPVIKNADQYNLVGLAKKVNDLARRARENKLKAEDLEGGTFTISNVGSFGNVMGTPIIMQPQVGILALGAVVKKPAVLETPQGDVIAIRHKMFLSHSYDHRVVDGSLGGMVVRRVADYLERFDPKRELL